MSINIKRLADSQYILTGAASIVTNPASTTTAIRNIHLYNSLSGSTESVILYRVPDSAGSLGTAADANILSKLDISPEESAIIDYNAPGIVLEDENDSLQAVTDTLSAVTISVDGFQEG